MRSVASRSALPLGALAAALVLVICLGPAPGESKTGGARKSTPSKPAPGKRALPPGGGSAGGTASPPAAGPAVVARVAGEPIRLDEIERRKDHLIDGYQRQARQAVPPGYEGFFRRSALEEAVRERLLTLDGQAQGIRVSEAAAESVLHGDPFFQKNGHFDAEKFEAYKQANPQAFAEVQTTARKFLIFQKNLARLERKLASNSADLAAEARARATQVRVHYALVSELQFDGKTDPTDNELRDYYAEHKKLFATPPRASLTTLSLPNPPVPDGAPQDSAMRLLETQARAYLARWKSGESVDSIGAGIGIRAVTESWASGQTRGVFELAPALGESALVAPAGRILDAPVSAHRGLVLVRVDQVDPGGAPPLAQVSNDLRARFRAEKSDKIAHEEARQWYEAHADSFTNRAWQVRWALVDSTRLTPSPPSEGDLKAWFESHKSEFARLDPSGEGVISPAFAEVRAQASDRWMAEQRLKRTRETADALASAWSQGRTDRSAEERATVGGPAWLVEAGALPPGLDPALADSVRSWSSRRAVVVPDPRGFAVAAAVRVEDRFRAPFESVEPRARERVLARQAADEEKRARAWYETHRERFRTGPGYAITYAISERVPPAQVDLPEGLIERYWEAHKDEYGSPPQVHVRHLLVTPGAHGGEAGARTLASSLLARARAGEDFAALARQYSEDPGSKDRGGDLGFVRKGQTVPSFERAAFALTEAQPLSGLVRSDYGYHILKLEERKEGVYPSLSERRGDVAGKLAEQYSDTLGRKAAYAFLATKPARADFAVLAEKRKFVTGTISWYEGLALSGPAVIEPLRADAAKASIGHVLPGVYRYLSKGYVTATLDSVLPSRDFDFDEIKDRVLQDFRREAPLEAARARADRLDEDLAAGRPFDETVECLGGATETRLMGYGDGLPSVGTVAGLDSVLYGPGSDTLAVGHWRRLPTPRGELFIQALERRLPSSDEEKKNLESLRLARLNYRLYEYAEELRKKYRVEVLRGDLAERLPPPPRI